MKFLFSKLKEFILNNANGFNYKKYWTRHDKIFNPKVPKILKLYYLYYLRKVDTKHGAHIYRILDCKNNFKSWPILWHGLKGIVIAGGAQIGKNCFISHQVTIGRSRGGVPIIGDDVYIGPGAKIFGNIKIGNHVRIGANCVVFEDVPDNATIVLQNPKIIIKDPNYEYFVYKQNNEE